MPEGKPCGQSKAKAAQQANTQNSVTCPIHKLKLADFNFICNPIRWWSGSLADYYLNLSCRWLQLEWLQSMRLGRNPPPPVKRANSPPFPITTSLTKSRKAQKKEL